MLVARIRPRANSNALATSPYGSRSSNIRPFLEKSLMDLRFNRAGAVAASILLVVVALVGASVLSRNSLGPSTLPPGGPVRDQTTGNFDQSPARRGPFPVPLIHDDHGQLGALRELASGFVQ